MGWNLAHLTQIWAIKFFFKNLALSVTRYHGQLSSCTISEKTNGPVFRKLSDGRSDRPTGWVGVAGVESDFIGRCRLTLSFQYKVVFGLFQKLFLKIYASQFMSICPFESGKCGKEGKKVQKFEYLENKRNFLDEIIFFFFFSFWRAIIW